MYKFILLFTLLININAEEFKGLTIGKVYNFSYFDTKEKIDVKKKLKVISVSQHAFLIVAEDKDGNEVRISRKYLAAKLRKYVFHVDWKKTQPKIVKKATPPAEVADKTVTTKEDTSEVTKAVTEVTPAKKEVTPKKTAVVVKPAKTPPEETTISTKPKKSNQIRSLVTLKLAIKAAERECEVSKVKLKAALSKLDSSALLLNSCKENHKTTMAKYKCKSIDCDHKVPLHCNKGKDTIEKAAALVNKMKTMVSSVKTTSDSIKEFLAAKEEEHSQLITEYNQLKGITPKASEDDVEKSAEEAPK